MAHGNASTAPVSTARRWTVKHPFLLLTLRRVASGVASLFVASMLIFASLSVLPGDAASVALGRNATPAELVALRERLGLDRPLVERYMDWLTGMMQGNFGDSTIALARNDPDSAVWGIIATPLVNSLIIAAIAIALLIPLALTLGAYTALRADKAADHAISTTSLAFGSMPEFLTGTLLIVVFFTWLDWLPPISSVLPGTSPLDTPDILVLPVATLLAASLAFTIRQVRASTIETLHQDYVGMARLNGYKEGRVIRRYALRNALAPSVQTLALTIQYLVGGIVITESVFNYPGIGNELVQAVGTRDIQLVAVITMLLAAIYIAINVVADLIVVLLVPKLRTQPR